MLGEQLLSAVPRTALDTVPGETANDAFLGGQPTALPIEVANFVVDVDRRREALGRSLLSRANEGGKGREPVSTSGESSTGPGPSSDRLVFVLTRLGQLYIRDLLATRV